jgi:hypothetical protein
MTTNTPRADRWLCCDGLHRPGFHTLLQYVLCWFGSTEAPLYYGRLYHKFGRGRCEVHVDIPPHPSHPSLMAWSTSTTGDDLGDMLERAAHKALTEFYERHLEDIGTPVALFPLRDEGNPTWNRRMAAACDTAQ